MSNEVGATNTGGIGDATIDLDSNYLRLDCSNGPLTSNLDLNGNHLILDVDGDSYINSSGDDIINFTLSGSIVAKFYNNAFISNGSQGFSLVNGTPTSTYPVVCPNRSDLDTGIGWSGADKLSIPVGGVSSLEITEDTTITISSHGWIDRHVVAGITASTTQSQGQQVLTGEVNEVSTCANANDVVTLPAAVAGRQIRIINNGAQTLQIFPNTDDDLGAGANNSTTLAATKVKTFQAYDTTNWVDLAEN
jgi:hypothetical protein